MINPGHHVQKEFFDEFGFVSLSFRFKKYVCGAPNLHSFVIKKKKKSLQGKLFPLFVFHYHGKLLLHLSSLN